MSSKPLAISQGQWALIRRSIIITGAPRSGTTLAGKLISSLHGLEYHFEPPTFYMICSLYASGQLPLETAASLLGVYLSEDLFLESVHARGVNLRPSDDSLVLNAKSWMEIHRRWTEVGNRADALKWIKREGLRLAVKMPNVLDAITLLEHTMPEMQVILVVRDGRDVVRSILRKGWVSDEGLQAELWPYIPDQHGVPIPYWVPEVYRARWTTMTPESRACVMWAYHAELAQRRTQSHPVDDWLIVLRYESLLGRPEETVTDIAARLGHKMTPFTRLRLEEIREPTSVEYTGEPDFYRKVDQDVLEWFMRVNRSWGYE